MNRAANWILERVNKRDATVGEGEAGERRCERHAVAGHFVRSILYGCDQMLANEPNGFFCQAIAERMAAFVRDRRAVRLLELVKINRGVRFNGMRQGIDP